jgi:hypothetical protein
MRPNLFRFATSELSQDALLCWLAQWSDPAAAEHDPLLHELGCSFLKLIFEQRGLECPYPISSLKIKKQHHNIDVLVIIDDAIAICLEDKAGSVEHSDQLRRYAAALKADGFSDDRILPVYVQTGEQSSYRSATDAGYRLIDRRQLIELLGQYLGQGGTDSIARDFHDHLLTIAQETQAFRTRPFPDWKWRAWQGFYSELQRELGEGNWAYVPNASDAFFGYWWSGHSDGESQQYMQLEQDCLCFKISVDEPVKRSELRSLWLARILAASREINFSAIRPRRFGNGQTMTVAMLEGDYRVGNAEGVLDLDATIRVLRTAANVLDRAVASANPKVSASSA